MALTLNRSPDPMDVTFECLANNPNVKIGMQQLEDNPNADPLYREMARSVIRECDEARKRKKDRDTMNYIAVVLILIAIFIGGTVLLFKFLK